MKIEKAVKLINFQSLLKINTARKRIDDYQNVEKDLFAIIDEFINNKNLDFDKSFLTLDESKPSLNVFILNDYGINANSSEIIMQKIKDHINDYKIIIGKKVNINDDKTFLKINKEAFKTCVIDVERIINDGFKEKLYSEINLYYVHYYNYSEFKFKEVKLFPIKSINNVFNGPKYEYKTDICEVIKGLISYYIIYQIQSAVELSIASENVLRKKMTDEGLRKIDNIKNYEDLKYRKEKISKSMKENVDIYKKNMEVNYE